MVELGEGCPLLKDIVLSHCRQITDVGLAHLVRNCTMLESCHMVYCQGITATGVATVVSSCSNIKKVMVEKWKVSPRTKRRAGSVITYLCVDLQITPQYMNMPSFIKFNCKRMQKMEVILVYIPVFCFIFSAFYLFFLSVSTCFRFSGTVFFF